MPKAFLVLNPVSGSLNPEIRRQKFEQHFERAGWDYEVYLTTGEEDLPSIVRQAVADGVDLVVASGGDGTISYAATGMVGTDIPLGILPSGTGNMFARDIAIPFDPDQALELITGEHALMHTDLMLAVNRAMVLNLSVGLSAQTILQTDREKKQRYGFLAYVGTVIANFFGLRLQTFYLEVDDKPYKFRASEVMLANSSLIGIRYLPLQGANIQPDDGQINICIIRARTLLNWLGVIANVITFHPERNARFKCIAAYKSVKINSNRVLPVQGDGEMLGTTPVEVTIQPQMLNIIVPTRRASQIVDRLMARITPLVSRQPPPPDITPQE